MKKGFLPLFAALLTLSASVRGQEQPDTLSITIDEVVVTGTRAEVARNNVPMTISVVGQREIEQSSESALLPVLSERIPGMFITERGVTGFGVSTGGSGGITMRGIGGSPTTGMLVLIDGHPQYMGIMGHHLPDAYVASDVERVEVVRGPASILYGSNAMGGVINIISRRQSREGWSAGGRLMYGSYNTQKYMGNAGIKSGKFDAFVSVNHDRTDGHRPNSNFHITIGYARAGVVFSDRLRLWGDVSVASYEAQNPGTVARPMFDNVANILRGVASLTLENRLTNSEGALKLFYNFGDHRINEGYAAGESAKDFRFRSLDQNFGANLYQIFRPLEGNTITAGVDFKSFGGHAWNRFEDGVRPDAQIVDTTMYEVAGYVIMQQRLGNRLTLNGGIRLEHHKAYGNQWVPQVGLAYNPAPYTVVKASVSKGFRSPTIREMFMWGGHNPALRPEQMTNYELSLGQSFLRGRLSAELTGFIADGSNMIQMEGTLLQNTGDFTNKGIEADFRWRATQQLDFQGNYSYLHLKKPVLYAPEQQAFLAGNYRLRKWDFSLSYQYVHGLYSAVGATPSRESYGLLNAKASFRPIAGLEFFAKGENLTDRAYQIMSGYPMPGFTLMAGLNFSFNGAR
jgi:iron complex outermembrane receptor protein